MYTPIFIEMTISKEVQVLTKAPDSEDKLFKWWKP